MKQLLFFLSGVLVGAVALFALLSVKTLKTTENTQKTATTLVEFNNTFPLTAPIISFQEAEESELFSKIDEKVEKYVTEKKITDKASIYYFSFKDGKWFGYREKQQIAPASLTKVGVALAAYKISETVDTNFLNREITYKGEFSQNQNIIDQNRISMDSSYTIRELLKQMFFYSDNEAFHIVEREIEKISPNQISDIENTYHLNVTKKLSSLKQYSEIFKSIYYATYIQPQHSQELLEMLTEQEFDEGLLLELKEEDITVAHKFGYYSPIFQQGRNSFVHCGIFYTQDPYLLCVSIRANSNSTSDIRKIVEHVGEISKMVYDYNTSELLEAD